ncbi:hypothetical protein K3495_g1628 [Podosphaera aphanis]|nr:hypothetical protein K3495_g1628 [Podosphaera aphanis]
MQSLGCEVAALNTVQFSNHLGYGKANGNRLSSSEILDLWMGLKQSGVDKFPMLLSGFLPDANSVYATGQIAQELRQNSKKVGGFFWVLDPVMGDNGKLYVAESMVPAYKEVIKNADLLIPNHFEAEILSGVQIVDLKTLEEAITTLHNLYQVPHILITSVSLRESNSTPSLAVVGSTKTSSHKPRPFIIRVPVIDCHFAGTGDTLAALLLVRLREAVHNISGLDETEQWRSPDEVLSTELPLARAAEKALGSVHEILLATKENRDCEITNFRKIVDEEKRTVTEEQLRTKIRSANCNAAELRLVRNISSLINPATHFKAEMLV